MHNDCAFIFEHMTQRLKSKLPIIILEFSSLLAPQASFGAASFQKMFNLDYEEKQFVNDLSL